MNLTLKKRVVIVENDKILLECFAYIINNSENFMVVGSYEASEDAISNLLKNKPDIILMDIELSGKSGIEATGIIKEKQPHIEILIVTVHEDNELVFSALRAGASGYITKSANYLEILAALEEIVKGGSPMSTKIARMVIHNFHMNPHSPFTKREKEVLVLIAEGKTYTQISEELFISRETAKTHIRNIYSKLQVNKKSDAIEVASKNRYI